MNNTPAGFCPYCNGSGGAHDQIGGLVNAQCPECGWHDYYGYEAVEYGDSPLQADEPAIVRAVGWNADRSYSPCGPCGACELCCYGQA